MHTIVIAGSTRIAVSVMRYYALREMNRDEASERFFSRPVEVDRITLKGGDRYEVFPAFSAARALEGAKVDRIIIASDYLRWHFAEPGEMTRLWHAILVAQAKRGAKIVWQ